MKAPVKIFDDAKADAGSAGSDAEAQQFQLGDAERQRCVDCGTTAPETETAYTLISPRHRWRLMKVVDASGQQVVEWRCAKCWARHRAKTKSST